MAVRWRSWWASAAVVAAVASAVGCSDDGGDSLPLTGTGLSNPGISVTRTVTDTRPADSAAVIVLIEVPFDEFDAPPDIDLPGVLDALGAAGYGPDAVAIDDESVFGVEVRVEVPPAQVPEAGPEIVRIVEEASELRAADSGVVFGLAECADTVAELRARAVTDAHVEAELLADAADVELGPIIGIADETFSWFEPDPTSACPSGQTGFVTSFSDGTSLYAAFDSPSDAEISVMLTVTYAIGGMATDAGAPAATLQATGSAVVRGDADDAFVVAYVDPPDGPLDEVIGDLEDELADVGVIDGDVVIRRGSYDTVVQVRIDPERVLDDAEDVLDAIESIVSTSYDFGIWYAAEACPDILDEARVAAFEDARDEAESLASTTGVELGAPVLVTDSSSMMLSIGPDRCETMPVDAVRYDYPVALATFDDEPELAVEVWLDVSFAVTG